MSRDIVLMFDEIYLQKEANYQGGDFIGADTDGTLYKGVVCFMIVGLKESVPIVIKAIPEVTIAGEWLKDEMLKSIEDLLALGFRVRAVVSDDHSSNVSAFNMVRKKFKSKSKYFFVFTCDLGDFKIYLFFDSTHLVKNCRNNLLLKKKFVFPAFSFDQFEKAINLPHGFLNWSLLHRVHEMDQKLDAHFKMAPKLNYRALHPGNNKQNVPLALAVFHETTSTAIRSYFPERVDAASFLELINTWWLISNAKVFSHPNRMGQPIKEGDKKIEFLNAMADWLEEWSSCSHFIFTPQTLDALIVTMRATAMLTQDLLREGYTFVRTQRFQTDPLERYYGRCRMMSGGRFLISLMEMNNSQRIILLKSLIMDDINFWKEDVLVDKSSQSIQLLKEEIAGVSNELLQCSLSEKTQEVCTMVTGYIVKKLNERLDCAQCRNKLVANGDDANRDDTKYIDLISRGGLTIPSSTVSKFVSDTFSILDFIDKYVSKYPSLNSREAATVILEEYVGDEDILCHEHAIVGRRRIFLSACNVFYNNKRKELTASVRKDKVEQFKKRQRSKEL